MFLVLLLSITGFHINFNTAIATLCVLLSVLFSIVVLGWDLESIVSILITIINAKATNPGRDELSGSIKIDCNHWAILGVIPSSRAQCWSISSMVRSTVTLWYFRSIFREQIILRRYKWLCRWSRTMLILWKNNTWWSIQHQEKRVDALLCRFES